MKRPALAALVIAAGLMLSACQESPGTTPAPAASTIQNYARDVAQAGEKGLPPGVDCMWEDITPDGHVTRYPAKDGQVIAVPNGTPHPYVAKCINGSLTAQPGSGDMPS